MNLLPFYYNAILNASGIFTKCTVLWGFSYAVIAVQPSVEWWLLRLASWACGMCSHTGSHTWKGLLFDLCSALTFWNSLNKVPHFPFALDLASYAMDPGNLCTFAFSTCIGSIIFRLYNGPWQLSLLRELVIFPRYMAYNWPDYDHPVCPHFWLSIRSFGRTSLRSPILRSPPWAFPPHSCSCDCWNRILKF